MGEVKTNWTKATTNPSVALAGLISCIEYGCNAWIEVRNNGEQEFPIMKKNPELDNPFNWTMSYGTSRNEKEMREHKYFNETEEDMTYNWTACYGEPDAIKQYQEEGIVSDGLFKGIGTCHPVRIADVEAYREKIDGYKYGYWVTYWKPKDNIPYWVVDDTVGKVFTICYDDEPVNKSVAMRRAATFLEDYADVLERK